MKKTIFLIITIIVAMILVGSLFFFTPEKNSDAIYWEAFSRNNKIFSVAIPDTVSFAGEATPIDLYYVREALDRELSVNTYWHSSTLFMFKRAHRWFPVIEPILKRNGIPDDFKYLALAESGFRRVVSPAGATGFWQFMKETGKEYGLVINKNIDERYHVEKATEAACRFLQDSYDIYNNWTLVAASYNAGRKRINNELERQKADTYYDLLLSEETSRYVFRILALKTIFSYPTRYGFYLREKDLFPAIPTYTVTVSDDIPDLAKFSIDHNINYRILKDFNPWLRQNHLNIKHNRSYEIKLPQKGYTSYGKLQKKIQGEDIIHKDTIEVAEIP